MNIVKRYVVATLDGKYFCGYCPSDGSIIGEFQEAILWSNRLDAEKCAENCCRDFKEAFTVIQVYISEEENN